MKIKELKVGNTFDYENKSFIVVEIQIDNILVRRDDARLYPLPKNTEIIKK